MAKPCPICGVAAVEKFRPFCSAKCADRDLINWASGTYAVPVKETDPDEDSELPDDSAITKH